MMTPQQHAIVADTVFDGATTLHDAAIVIEDGQIAGILPRTELPAAVATRRAPYGSWLAPGFIDLQVNGGGDVLFNDDPTPAGIAAIAAAHRKFGTTALLPTLISDTDLKMRAALAAAETAMERNPSILGIHFEGPFLSPDRAGIHDLHMIRPPTPEDGAGLRSPRKGVAMMTLAPERVPSGFIAHLADAGVRVSLGHSMATYVQTRAAMEEGLTGFTHLFNAMRPLASREPGPIAAALEADNAWFGMIVDGVHVDPAMLRLALRGTARAMLVTDAMPPVGGNRTAFTVAQREITIRNGCCVASDGTLAGTCVDMATVIGNCVRLLGVPLTQALRAASAEPAAFLGLGDRLGRLAPGYRADIVAFDPAPMRIIETWVAGIPSAAATGPQAKSQEDQ